MNQNGGLESENHPARFEVITQDLRRGIRIAFPTQEQAEQFVRDFWERHGGLNSSHQKMLDSGIFELQGGADRTYIKTPFASEREEFGDNTHIFFLWPNHVPLSAEALIALQELGVDVKDLMRELILFLEEMMEGDQKETPGLVLARERLAKLKDVYEN